MLTTEEFLNRAYIAPDSVTVAALLAHIEPLEAARSVTEGDLAEAERRIERLEEQIYFAQDLIDCLTRFSETLPKTKQAAFKALLDNSSFEL